MININVPNGATPQTEVRRTVQSRRRYYVYMPPGTRSLADPVRLQIRTVVEPEPLEPDSDIRAVALQRRGLGHPADLVDDRPDGLAASHGRIVSRPALIDAFLAQTGLTLEPEPP